ncbi:hypothetical protein [Nocardioides ultimimeridianus]
MPLDLAIPAPGTFTAHSPKHAPTVAPEPAAGDVRSVGELLIASDYQARTLLLDVEAAAAPGLLRAWAETVAAAADLWKALPGPEYAGVAGRRTIERVTELAGSIQADLDTARWPGAGPGDHRMHGITDNLGRARQLVDKYGSEIAPHQPRVQKDLEAARTRIVHTLYIATHGVVVALNEDGRQRASDPTRTEALRAAAAHYRGRYEVGPGVRWASRLGVAERVLGSYLQPGNYAQALAHERTAPVEGLPRLREALARFDIQAHRTLVAAPHAGNLVLAARTEGMFFGAALVLARAAAETGHLEPAGIDPTRLEQRLTAAGEAWMGLARRWRDLMPQGTRLDPALGATAAQLRSACRELTHNGDQLAPTAVILQRVDLAAALPVIAHYVDAAVEIAEATRPALRDPDLVAPSRAVVHRLATDIDEGLLPDSADTIRPELISIAARDNRLGPVPPALLAALDGAVSKAYNCSATAAGALPPVTVRTGACIPISSSVCPEEIALGVGQPAAEQVRPMAPRI